MHISKDCVAFLMPHEDNGKCYSSVWIRTQMDLSNFKQIGFFFFLHLSTSQTLAVPGVVCCPAAQSDDTALDTVRNAESQALPDLKIRTCFLTRFPV